MSTPLSSGPAPLRQLDLVIGTRPNIVKAGPLHSALRKADGFRTRVVFLMQHTDPALADHSLADVGIDRDAIVAVCLREPDLGRRLGEMVAAYSAELHRQRPDLVLVFGDVDTTLAAAYAAKRAQLPVAHVEAGLRSHDRTMPEELNRLMVDAISDLHLATSREAVHTLVAKEGHAPEHVRFVGNLMIDALLSTLDRPHGERLCAAHGLVPGRFALATFHRPSNVDSPETLRTLARVLRSAAARLPVVWPVHPRTAAAIERFGLEAEFATLAGTHRLPPLRYRDFVSLLAHARVALTDSGGLQEETSVLGIPCLTLRANTERPVTVDQGSNLLAEPTTFAPLLDQVLARPLPPPATIEGWDGHATERIVAAIREWVAG